MTHVAFMSYAHADDDHSGGKLVNLCRWLEEDVRALTGNDSFTIFLDREDIKWGQRWRRVIDGGLNESAFLIPVISPRYLNRPECQREFLEFLKKERRVIGGAFAVGCEGLILPLLYLDLPPNCEHEIAKEARARQWVDIKPLSFGGKKLRSKLNGQLVRTIAERLVELFDKFASAATGNCGTEPLTSHRGESLIASFAGVSEPLLAWPATMPNGSWLDRIELSQLLEACNAEPPSAHVIVGPPGAGKSALLARLAHQCRDAGLTVLGIKADFLPQALSTVGELSAYILGHPGNLTEEVRWLAATRKVIVIIDQLDALADLVDLKSGRLDLLLNLIQALRGQKNVHLFCSSRTYELHHDLRLNGLTAEGDRPGLTVVELQPLRHEQIASQLGSAGINAAQWPDSYFEFLSIPYRLRAFLEHVASGPESGSAVPEQSLFASIHSIHEMHWRQSVVRASNSPQRVGVLERLAERISDTEALRQPVALFDEFGTAITDLEQAGWLHSQASSIGFAHQTQYEFLLARRFAGNPDGFIRHVLEREHGLFVRPLVWHTLNYARTANLSGYLQMVGGLLDSVTRRHLRMLLIDFLGQISDPQEQEVIWVTHLLNDPATYALMAFRLWKQPGWYAALSSHVLPALMGQPADQCWPVARVLEYAWPFASDRNRELLRDHWSYREERAHLLWTVVADSPSFDEELVKWLCWVASTVDIAPWALRHAAENVAKSLPEAAPRILAAGLNRRLDVKLAEHDPPPPPSSDDPDDAKWIFQQAMYEPRARISAELESNEWHDAEKIAKQSPSAFLRELWPWFWRAIENSDQWHRSRLDTFRHEHGYDHWFHSELGLHYPLPQAVLIAIQELARTDAEAFAEFVEQNSARDSMAVQRLLAIGLVDCASKLPSLCFQFLITDSRRFFLGTSQSGMSAATALVVAASSHWTAEQLVVFQRMVLNWNPYRADEVLGQAENEYSCEYRARLLRELPAVARLPESDEVVAENETSIARAFERDAENQRGVREIKSPVDAAEMEQMSDGEIIALFDRLHDATETQHPHNWRVGGSEQASYQFREFAKKHPARAADIIRLFRSGIHERPAGYGLVALADVKFDSAIICDLVRELDQNGFSKPEFRDDVGQALQDVAIANLGLPDDLCQRLSQWLLEDDIPETPPNENEKANEEKLERSTSILWNRGGGFITLPHRWYWIGVALKLGLCLKEPPRSEDWMNVLAQCIKRPFPKSVWITWLWDFTSRYLPDRAAVAPIIANVLAQRPDVFASESGIRALAHFSNWLDQQTQHELLNQLRDSDWNRSQQAEGELVGLWALRDDDEQCWERIETWLAAGPDDSGTESCRIGLAFAAANMWTDSAWRAEAASILCRLTTVNSPDVGKATLHAFLQDGCLRTDSETREFLKSLGEHFDFASVGREYWMSRRLVDFLPHEPELILRVCQRIVTTVKKAASDNEFRYGSSVSHLIAIALTLHRNPDATIRTEALALFEDLLELDAYHASQALTELDQRPIPTRSLTLE